MKYVSISNNEVQVGESPIFFYPLSLIVKGHNYVMVYVMFPLSLCWKKVIPHITFFILLLLNCNICSASENNPDVEKINQLIHQKLGFYNKIFPDIQFVYLKNDDWSKSRETLELFIGNQATNLDYEHPADLRQDLLLATVEKIRIILKNKITSSYLFKTGQVTAATKPHICVITIDPATTVLNNRVATSYLLDFPGELIDSMPERNYINNEHHLEFILDHEAFHCLDTFYYSGIPMSHQDYSTRYNVYKRESQADMYAIAMNAYRNKVFTSCANNMKMIRGMTLLNGEPQHLSVEAMQLIMNFDQTKLVNMTPHEIFRIVKELYKKIEPDYDEYMTYRVAAIEAIKQLGVEVNEYEKPFCPPGSIPDKKLVHQLVTQTKVVFKEFTDRNFDKY